MDASRIRALANLLDALGREQLAEGFQTFTITSDDKVSPRDAEVIVAGLLSLAGDEGTRPDLKIVSPT